MDVAASGGIVPPPKTTVELPDISIEPAQKTPAERTADMITLSPAAKAKLAADAKGGP